MRLIQLHSSPLGLIVRAPSPSKPQVGRCLAWVQAMLASGAVVVIPEITHYEVRRELLRIRAIGSLRRLEFALDRKSGFRHLTLSTDAIIDVPGVIPGVRSGKLLAARSGSLSGPFSEITVGLRCCCF